MLTVGKVKVRTLGSKRTQGEIILSEIRLGTSVFIFCLFVVDAPPTIPQVTPLLSPLLTEVPPQPHSCLFTGCPQRQPNQHHPLQRGRTADPQT
jgi:hypothetical protein